MRVGLTCVYPFRPHVEHLCYLGWLLAEAGHQTRYLSCDGALPACYSKLLRGHGRARERTTCVLGGIRTFPVTDVRRMDPTCRADLPEARKEEIVFSSAATICRTEAPSDRVADDVVETRRRLHAAADVAYGNAVRWLKDEALDAVLCYNGRMAATRAIIEACRDHDVPFATYERSWLGDGLRMIPGANCLSLEAMGRIVGEYASKPLSARQAEYAGGLAAQRFLSSDRAEWRVYNPNPASTRWPTSGAGLRTLILPSSRNEFAGHPEWACEWDDVTKALDVLLDVLSLSTENCVLRCHPNWSETIGKIDGRRSEHHYAKWAQGRGIRVIGSSERANTYDLLREADLVVVNGSSTGAEAALVGKPVVCLGRAPYERAGFSVHLERWNDFDDLDSGTILAPRPEELARRALRYLFSRARRFPQYADEVKADSAVEYRYYEGGDAGRIVSMLQTGMVPVYDDEVGRRSADENGVVEHMLDGRWSSLAWNEQRPYADGGEPLEIARRSWLRWIEATRRLMARGDR